jgi:hypothetical protein
MSFRKGNGLSTFDDVVTASNTGASRARRLRDQLYANATNSPSGQYGQYHNNGAGTVANYQTNGLTSTQYNSGMTGSQTYQHPSLNERHSPQYPHDLHTHGNTNYTLYANEITVEDDQGHISSPTSAPPDSYHQNQPSRWDSTYNNGYAENTTPYYNTHSAALVRSHNGYGNASAQRTVNYSPTTERWSAEYSSDERIRLGLPRYIPQQQCPRSDHSACNHGVMAADSH